MPRYLIDKQGQTWDPYDDRLLVVLGDPQPDYDILSYAVRNLGAIDIEIRERNVEVRFRRLTVSPPALDTVARMLIGLPVDRIIIRCEAEQWNEQTFSTPEAAVAWIETNGTILPASGGRNMVTTPRRLESLAERRLSRIEDGDDRLALIFKKWRMSQGTFDSDTGSFLIRFGLLDRTAVVSESSGDGALVIEHAATSFQCYDNYDRSWNLLAQGKRVSDMPDPEFGRWIDNTYRGVIDEKQPRFEHVDAVVHARGAEPYRFRYNRLLLPWRSAEGLRVITGTSYNEFAGRVVD